MGPLSCVRPGIHHTEHRCWMHLLLLLPLLPLREKLSGAHALALRTLTTNTSTLTADDDGGLRLGSYLYEYKGLSWLFIEMWREYEKLDMSLRHLLWDYSLAVGQEKYRQLVKTLAQKELKGETVLRHQREDIVEDERGTGNTPQQSRMRRRSRARLVRVAIATATRLREVKQQLGCQWEQLQRLLNQKQPARLLESIDFLDNPVDITHALQVDNAELFHGSLRGCIDCLEALEKTHRQMKKTFAGLKNNDYVPSREDVLLQTLEVENFFDTEAPVVLHVPSKRTRRILVSK